MKKIDSINTYYVEGTKGDVEKALLKIRNIRKQIKALLYNGETDNVANTYKPIETIDVGERLNLRIKTEVVLYAISDMSIPLTQRHDEMREEYLKKYPTKKEAQKEFLKDYYALHKPYDKVKTLCWKTLFLLKGLDENGDKLKKNRNNIFG